MERPVRDGQNHYRELVRAVLKAVTNEETEVER